MEFEHTNQKEIEPSLSGHLYIISGFTAAGKDSLIKNLVSDNPNNKHLTSYTSRRTRDGEKDGIEYFFVDKNEFEEMMSNDELLQYMKTGSGEYYGTRKQDLLSSIKEGNTFWNISMEFASKLEQVLKNGFDDKVAKDILSRTTKILIDVPRLTVAKDRSKHRESISNNVLLSRLKKQFASYQLYKDEFDYCVVNDQFEQTVKEINQIIEI